MTVRVAVIVPVFEGAGVLERCLASLDRQTLPPEAYEVVVADDGSTDGSAAVVEGFAASARARIRVVRLERNRGPAAARNTGLAATGAAVVAFTDADCEVAPDWLERALARLEADPSLAGVEGRTDPRGEPGTLTHQMRNPSGGLWMTCNMVYRREALAGGFDERFRAAFLEDSDLAFGVLERGGRIDWAPEVVVHHQVLHEGRRKFWRDARKRFYNPLLHRKHPRLYREHLHPVVPGLPELHMFWMGVVTLAAVTLALRAWWAALAWGPLGALYLRRLAHAYRARDPVSVAQVALVPFVQTFWVLAGALRFRSFSPRL